MCIVLVRRKHAGTHVIKYANMQAGVYLAIHPDDPPMPLLGLPRVVSTTDDVEFILRSVDSVHNGLTFCVGRCLALFEHCSRRH